MSEQGELLPCPFCGGEAARDTWDADRDYAGCRECDFWTLVRIWQVRAAKVTITARGEG